MRNSRKAESEADLLGTDIMYDTGFNPRAMADFFTKMAGEGGARGSAVFQRPPRSGKSRRGGGEGSRHSAQERPAIAAIVADFRDIKQRVGGMKPLTAQQIAERAATGALQRLSRRRSAQQPACAVSATVILTISYPENWQVFGDQNSAVTIAPPNGVTQNAVAYGVMINTYQPEDANASLDQATHDLLASLRQSNPDLRAIGHDENIRVNGVAGKSVDLIGTSPLQDQSGRPGQERDWLVAFMRRDGTLLYMVSIAPDKDFESLRPTFEQMLKSMQLR